MFKRQIKTLLITFLTLISIGMKAFGADDVVRFKDLYEIDGVFYKKFSSEPFNGLAEEYFVTDRKKVKKRSQYFKGKKQWEEAFCDNGRLQYKHKYDNGTMFIEPKKPIFTYHCNGNIRSQYGVDFVINDRNMLAVLSTTQIYYENGNLKSKETKIDGKLSRVAEYYDENGFLRSSVTYVNDIADGEYKVFHPNGSVKIKGLRKNGKNDFWSFEYDKNGTLIKKRFYNNGQMINPIISTSLVNSFPICQILSSKGQFCKSLDEGDKSSYSFQKMDQYQKNYINPKRAVISNGDWRYSFDIIETDSKTQIRLTDESLTATYYTVVTYDVEFNLLRRNWFLVGSVVEDIRGSEDDRKVIGQYRKYDPPIPFLEMRSKPMQIP